MSEQVMVYRLTWQMVHPISHPKYYTGDDPNTPPAQVPDACWNAVEKVEALAPLARQYKGLKALEARGEYIRNVLLWQAPQVPPQWTVMPYDRIPRTDGP